MDKQFRLPKEFAEKWLTALRSGKYKQAVETLYDPDVDGFCCLGVACVLEYPLHYLKTETGRFGGVIEKSFKQLKFQFFDHVIESDRIIPKTPVSLRN